MIWPRPKDPDSARQVDRALEIARQLCRIGYPSYLIGGAVRDSILEIPTLDVDICTSCPADIIRESLPEAKPWGPRRYSVFRVVTELGEIEIAHFRKELDYDGRHCVIQLVDNFEEDVHRRDFTVNAIAVNPDTLEVIDLVGGFADISARVIRAIGEPAIRFKEDRLRMLRAVRFAAKLGFRMENATLSAITLEGSGIKSLSAERIRNELSAIVSGPHPGRGMLIAHELGLWEHLFPERADDPQSRGWERKLSTAERAAQAGLDKTVMWALFLLPAGEPEEEDILAVADAIRRLKFPKRAGQRILELCKAVLYAKNFADIPLRIAIEIADAPYLESLRELVYIRDPNDDFETELARRFPMLDKPPFLTGEALKKAIAGIAGNEVRRRLIALRGAELSGKIRSAEEARAFLADKPRHHQRTRL